MTILSRARERGERFFARRLRGETLAFSAEIRGSAGPLWQLQLEAQAEPEAQGERLRMRAHFRLRLRRHQAPPALQASTLPARLGRWIEKRLESPLAQTLAAPLLDRDFSSWVELRASSAALDEGSRALLPERLGVLGIEPQAGRTLQTWAGGTGGARPGFAVLALLQLDKEKMPPRAQRALGTGPFQLTATIASVVEEVEPE
jgi:hypothetical protein